MGSRVPKVLYNFNVHIDGVGYAGLATEIKLPDLSYKIEEHLAGGLDHPYPINMSLESMEMTLTFAEVNGDIAKLVGIFNGGSTRIQCYGALNDNTSQSSDPVQVTAEGNFTKYESTAWKAGEKTEEKYTFKPIVYQETIAGTKTVDIDTLNMKRVIGGTDYLEQIRSNIKL